MSVWDKNSDDGQFLGGVGLVGFLWALRSGQFEDLDGAAHRILGDDEAKDSD
jgi:cbb3-type cytochrome oxidase maturation protein